MTVLDKINLVNKNTTEESIRLLVNSSDKHDELLIIEKRLLEGTSMIIEEDITTAVKAALIIMIHNGTI